MKKMLLIMGAVSLMAGFGSAVYAQTAPMPAPDATQGIIDEGAAAAKPKVMAPKVKMPKPAAKVKAVKSVTIKITNARAVPVTALSLGLSGTDTGKSVIKSPLAPSKSVSIKLDTKKGCTFDIRGAFEDDAAIEADSVDFCADHDLVLKD